MERFFLARVCDIEVFGCAGPRGGDVLSQFPQVGRNVLERAVWLREVSKKSIS